MPTAQKRNECITFTGNNAMLPENRITTHPGEVLLEEFLSPLGVTRGELAKHLDVPVQRINEIVRGRRGISSEMARLLAQSLGTTPEFWTTLQSNHDLTRNRPSKRVRKLSKVV